MFVKVCGLTTESDTLAAVNAGADAIGLVLTDSCRRVSAERARELCELAGDALTVAVFRGEPITEILEAARVAGVDAVQPHGRYPAGDLRLASAAGLTVIRAATPADGPLECGAHGEDLLLVDSTEPGSGRPWDWTADRVRPTGRWLLAGGLRVDNLTTAVTALRPWGVDVSSGVEVGRGIKDQALITAFVSTAKGLDTGGHPRRGRLAL